MRILQVITLSSVGGAQSVVRELVKGLTARGHEVGVASSAGGPLWETLGPGVHRFPLARMRRGIAPLTDLVGIFELRSLNRDFRPDVVHLHSSKAGALGRIGFPPPSVVYTMHGFDSIARAHRLFLPVERALAGRAARIVGVSEYDRRAMVERGICPWGVIRNGVADPSTEGARVSLDALESLRRRHGFLAISVARLSPPKRFDIVLATARLLEREGIGVAWVGGARAPSMAFPENFVFVPEMPNAAGLLHLADAFVLASDYEGLPISVIEALAWGKPIVASRVGGLAELVGDGINGFLVDNAPALFARALRLIRADPDLSVLMGNASRRRYEANFGLERMLNEYERLYMGVHRKEHLR